MKYFLVAAIGLTAVSGRAQNAVDYLSLRSELITRFQDITPGKFGHPAPGVFEESAGESKILALTFDACGGTRGDGFDAVLISYLQQEKIPATLFLNGRWIDDHPTEVKLLAADTLFEIENHGWAHRPCSITGAVMYGIRGTGSILEVVDEIEINAQKIQGFTGRKPVFYRPGTATNDEACGKIAGALGETVVNYDVLSGDAVSGTPAATIMGNILTKARNGAVVIMHMNHPEWHGAEALKLAIPELRKRGYSFVNLRNFPSKGHR